MRHIVKFLRRLVGVLYYSPALLIFCTIFLAGFVIDVCILLPLEWLFTGDCPVSEEIFDFLYDDLWKLFGAGFRFIVGD